MCSIRICIRIPFLLKNDFHLADRPPDAFSINSIVIVASVSAHLWPRLVCVSRHLQVAPEAVLAQPL